MSNFQSCAGLIISASNQKILLDANMGLKETPELIKEEQPDIAIVSHYHLDHATWGATALKHSKAELFAPMGEEKYLTSLEYFVTNTVGGSLWEKQWQKFAVDIAGYQAVNTISTYIETNTFQLRDVKITPIKTAGHSPHHMSFYFPDDKILFTGDMGLDLFGPWYGWKDCYLKDLIDSILRLKNLDVDVLLTSHGGMITKDIKEAWDKVLKQIIDREQTVRKALDQGVAKKDIVEKGIFYRFKSKVKEPMRSFLYMWDSMVFEHHLELLEEGGILKFFSKSI